MSETSRRGCSKYNFEQQHLKQILDHLPNPIFVTDRNGNVLLSNSATAVTLDMTLDQLLNSNVRDLVEEGYYNKSYGLEVARKKQPLSGQLVTKLGLIYLSTSTPILDGQGNVQFIITTGRPMESADKLADEETKMMVTRYKREREYLRSYVLETDTIVAESEAMRHILLAANNVAQADSTVLLYGESGTGKEVLAKYIHRHSKRAKGAFIAVNCAAFPEHLVESELFGYQKGAFTGANSEGRMGLFEAAQYGTLFLDEIAELPMPLQSKLLRVLETGEIRRLGSTTNRHIDFRLIVATHKDLRKMTQEGTFRNDLYYRLSVIPIKIPPLRERPEDISVLATKFLSEFNKKYGAEIEFDLETLAGFQRYNWPGNVRELRNEIERIVILGLRNYPKELLDLSATLSMQSQQPNIFKFLGLEGTLKEVVRSVEKQYIDYVLKACRGRMGEAAKKLGIYRTVLYRKLKSYEKENKKG